MRIQAMLREIPNTKQVAGEPPRKWYFSQDLDLVVWFDPAGVPCAFQLAYDKYKGEHSIAWHSERGYRHSIVDDGERQAGDFETPLLYANGPFKKDSVLEKFLKLSEELPSAVKDLVVKKLREFDGPIQH
jgi:hypothetical protein